MYTASYDLVTASNLRSNDDPPCFDRHGGRLAAASSASGMGWAQFLRLHWEVLAATDFFTAEVATWHGLVTYYVLVVMELATRRVQIAGITPHPTAAFMQQCARQLTDPFEGFLVGKRYLLHDRDTGQVRRRERLGGLLNYYHREAA